FGALVDCERRKLAGRHIAAFAGTELTEKLVTGEGIDGRMREIEVPVMTGGGSEIWCVVSAVALSMGGEAIVLIGCYDVTDRHRAQEALRESASNLAAAERIAHLGNWQLDIDSGTITCSDEAFRIFGGEPQGKGVTLERFLDRVHPSDQLRMRQATRDAIELGQPFRTTHRIVLANGDVRYIRSE